MPASKHRRKGTTALLTDQREKAAPPTSAWGCARAMSRKPFLICLVSLTMIVPSIVIAQSNTAFDGTYAGVSNTATGGGPDCNPIEPKPRPLTVSNGIARVPGGWFTTGHVAFEGSVSPQGDFKISDLFEDNLVGKIDASGKAAGSFSVGDTGCVLTAVWQRQ